jgi:hypothetical protein
MPVRRRDPNVLLLQHVAIKKAVRRGSRHDHRVDLPACRHNRWMDVLMTWSTHGHPNSVAMNIDPETTVQPPERGFIGALTLTPAAHLIERS